MSVGLFARMLFRRPLDLNGKRVALAHLELPTSPGLLLRENYWPGMRPATKEELETFVRKRFQVPSDPLPRSTRRPNKARWNTRGRTSFEGCPRARCFSGSAGLRREAEMTREFPMPSRDESEPTEFAGQEPQFARQALVTTDQNEDVIIVDYLKDKGLYVVSREDGHGPLFRISPARLRLKHG